LLKRLVCAGHRLHANTLGGPSKAQNLLSLQFVIQWLLCHGSSSSSSSCEASAAGLFNENMAFQSAQSDSAAPSSSSGLRLLFINETGFEAAWITRNMVKCLLWCLIC
jgi:hypothetical protein